MYFAGAKKKTLNCSSSRSLQVCQLQKILEDTIEFQSDPTGQVVSLNKKKFKLSNKNLNFVLKQIKKDADPEIYKQNKQTESYRKPCSFLEDLKKTTCFFQEEN